MFIPTIANINIIRRMRHPTFAAAGRIINKLLIKTLNWSNAFIILKTLARKQTIITLTNISSILYDGSIKLKKTIISAHIKTINSY